MSENIRLLPDGSWDCQSENRKSALKGPKNETDLFLCAVDDLPTCVGHLIGRSRRRHGVRFSQEPKKKVTLRAPRLFPDRKFPERHFPDFTTFPTRKLPDYTTFFPT